MEGEIEERLLRGGSRETAAAADDDDDEEAVNLETKLWRENKKMWVLAAPAIFTRFISFGINVISQAFIGHVGSTELAAYSLVFTVLLRFSNGILLGMSSALETLCGQAYGAKQYHMLGIYLQRSWLVLLMCTVLLLPIYIFAAPILKALGQENNVADMAGYVAQWFIPVIFSYVLSFTCQMFLQAQSKNVIIAYLAAITVVIHLFLSWLLIVKLKFGVAGALISTDLAFWIPNIGQLLFVVRGGCPKTWRGFSSLAFKDLWPVIKLSLSSGVMVCLEIWYNTVLLFLTGYMKNAEIAIDALAICLNINGLEMMIALGFFSATRVSNELGRGSSKAAKFAVANIVLTSTLLGFIFFVVFLFLRGKPAYFFTNNPEVVDAVGDLSPLLAVSILLNSIEPVLSGVAVGAGWQGSVAYINIACYYLIGIPLGAVLGYVLQLQVKGVWVGMLIGTFVQTIVLIIIIWKIDWDNQVTIAQSRINKWIVADSTQEQTNQGE